VAFKKLCFAIITVFSLHFLKAIFNHASFIGAVCDCWGSLLSLSWLLLFSARFSVSHPSTMLRLLSCCLTREQQTEVCI